MLSNNVSEKDHGMTTANHRQLNNSPFAKLSRRELQCVYFYSRGMSANAIGQKLGLSGRTIEDYLERAKNKLTCANKFELINYVISNSLFSYSCDFDVE